MRLEARGKRSICIDEVDNGDAAQIHYTNCYNNYDKHGKESDAH